MTLSIYQVWWVWKSYIFQCEVHTERLVFSVRLLWISLLFSAFVLLKMWFMKVFALMQRSLFISFLLSVYWVAQWCAMTETVKTALVWRSHTIQVQKQLVSFSSIHAGLHLLSLKNYHNYLIFFTIKIANTITLVVKGQEFKDELLKCKERLVPEQQTRVPAAAGGEAAAVGVSTVQLQREAWAEWKSGFQHHTEGRQVASWHYSTGKALVGLKMASISSWAQSYKKAAGQSYCVFITWTLPKSSVSLPPPGFKTVGSGVKIEE